MNNDRDHMGQLRRWLLVMFLIAAVLALLWRQVPSPAEAYDKRVGIDCNDGPVTEGNTFRLYIYSVAPYVYAKETMKVYWSTIAQTADESDYRPLRSEGQASNGYQTEESRMGRTFYTKEDQHSELTETYKVRARNATSGGSGAGSCTIEIKDDDGPGAVKTWIVSMPTAEVELPAEDSSISRYHLGDTIRIKQEFTEDVVVDGGAVTLGLHIGSSDDYVTREASYSDGTGTDTITYEYQVTADDLDQDGFDVAASSYGGEGTLYTDDDNSSVNDIYLGLEGGIGHRIYGGPYVEELSLSSSPADGQAYQFEEEIQFQASFDRAVTVDGDAAIRVQVGEGRNDWVDASYSSGSGTDTLTFSYAVATGDFDADGVSIEPGYVDVAGVIHGMSAGSAIKASSGGQAMDPYYSGLIDQAAHKVDSAPEVTDMSVTSTPKNGESYRMGEEIQITVTYDQDVSLDPPLSIPLTIGDGLNAQTWTAEYDSSSHDNLVVFSYTVAEGQLDNDGISVSPNRRILDDGTIYAYGTSVVADRAIPELPDQPGHKVYGFRPYVFNSSLTSAPAAGDTYLKGETIEVSLTFNYEVEVEGTPAIKILLGGERDHRSAAYSSGSGTDTLAFSYEVQPGDEDSDGIALMARDSGGFQDGHVNEAGTSNHSKGKIPGFGDQSAHKVAGTPHITTAAITSTSSDGVYSVGETIEVTLTFDQAVDVEPTPWIRLNVGDDEKEAAYISGTGTNTLVFDYRVQAGDADSDGVSLVLQESDGFGGSGGITAAGTEVAARDSIPALADQGEHAVDGVAPTLVSAETSSDGSQVTVTFSEDVDVATDLRTLSTFAGVDVGLYIRALVDVFADGYRLHSSGAEISGSDLVLTLDTAITHGEAVELSYDNVFTIDLPDLLIDGAGNHLERFSDQSVSNRSTLPDRAGLIHLDLSAYSLAVADGGTATYTVALSSQPDSDVTVSLAVEPSSRLTADTSTLTFTSENWNTPQTVTLTADTNADELNFWQEIIHTSDYEGFVTSYLRVLIEN